MSSCSTPAPSTSAAFHIRCLALPPARLSHRHYACCRYLVTNVERYTSVDETNKEDVVESLRMMSELIIWGDQNNSSVLA